MRFGVLHNLKDCRAIWNQFSPQEFLWDVFEVRYCFHTKDYQFHFIAGYEEDECAGVLPLIYDKKFNNYYFFGELFPERNRLLMKNKSNCGMFFDQLPEGSYLNYIDSSEKEYYPFTPDEPRFFLDMRKYDNSLETYLHSFKKKRRKNWRNELKKLNETGYTLHKNRVEDYERLVQLNKKRFKDSDFKEKSFVESIKKLMLLAEKNKWLNMISVEIDGKVEGVEIGIMYNNIYYVVAVGKNLGVKNIGKLLFFEHIKDALTNKCSILDFCTHDTGWKERFHLEAEPMWQFVKE